MPIFKEISPFGEGTSSSIRKIVSRGDHVSGPLRLKILHPCVVKDIDSIDSCISKATELLVCL